ncbi:MAG: hypothetical protein MHPSP_002814 [Paramarteilia canceri]
MSDRFNTIKKFIDVQIVIFTDRNKISHILYDDEEITNLYNYNGKVSQLLTKYENFLHKEDLNGNKNFLAEIDHAPGFSLTQLGKYETLSIALCRIISYWKFDDTSAMNFRWLKRRLNSINESAPILISIFETIGEFIDSHLINNVMSILESFELNSEFNAEMLSYSSSSLV